MALRAIPIKDMRSGCLLEGFRLFGGNCLFFFRKADKGPEGFHRGLGRLLGVAGVKALDGGSDELWSHRVEKLEIEPRPDALEALELVSDAHGATRAPIGDECIDQGTGGWAAPVPAICTGLRFPLLSAQISTPLGGFRRSFLTPEGPLRHGEDMGGGTKDQYSLAGCRRIPGGDHDDKNPEAPS